MRQLGEQWVENTKEHCGMGTGEHVVKVECPKWLYVSKTHVMIDRCIVDEIKFLWSKGIRTYGSCCGHGKMVPMVNVHEDDVPVMLELGYIGGKNRFGAPTFALKSFNGGFDAQVK